MSIKKLPRKRGSHSSNLTIRMTEDRMTSDRMSGERGPGGIIGGVQRPSLPSTRQNKFLQRSEDVDQEDSSEKK